MKKRQSLGTLRHRLRFEPLEHRRMLAPFVVENTNDSGDGSLRAAIAASNDQVGKDEITFAADLFTSGTPIIRLETPIEVQDPVVLHSPDGPGGESRKVQLQPAFGFDPQEALLIQPSLNGTAARFEISDLIIVSFTYGIRVDTGGVPTANAERVRIEGNEFRSNARGIYLEDALYSFEILDNEISGIGGSSPGPDSGIWIASSTTQSNAFVNLIAGNFIGNHNGSGIFVDDVNMSNLSIVDNEIGATGLGFSAPNYYGVRIYDGSNVHFTTGNVRGSAVSENNIVNNHFGLWIESADGIEIDGNTIANNVASGIRLGNGAIDHTIENNNFIENGGAAVVIGTSLSDTLTFHNRVSDNYFEDNGGLPIDIGANGVFEPNDFSDLDTGPNGNLNNPEIMVSAIIDEGSRWRVPVQLDIRSPGRYRLEFYRYDATTNKYTFIRAETLDLSAMSGPELNEDFHFQRGSEVNVGQFLAALTIYENSSTGAVINDSSELRKANLPFVDGPPRIVDVRLSGRMPNGAAWTRAPYSYAAIVPTGNQLAPIPTGGVNKIEVVFGEDVQFSALNNHVRLYNSNGVVQLPTAMLSARSATWTFASALPADKYRLEILGGVTDVTGKALDGEWTNLAAPMNRPPTFDNFTDDPTRSYFLSGTGSAGGTFRFLFSLLGGDSNRDGVVTDADDNPGVLADIDGDNDADSTDQGIVASLIGTELSLRARDGDYKTAANDDDINNLADYMAWKEAYGDVLANEADGYLEEDGNGNGIVDTADYNIWQNHFGHRSAWYQGTPTGGSGASIPLVLPGAPRVANVIVSGSSSLHAPYSFDTVDGSGQQLRTIPVGEADTISVRFSEDVNIQSDSAFIVGLYSGHRPTVAEFIYDVPTMTATWRLADPFGPDQYAIHLSESITDVEGIALDGEWNNPASITTSNPAVSVFPSGDGTAGGDFVFVFTPLPGDSNRDGVVNSSDFDTFYSTYGLSGPYVDWSYCDMNGDQVVDYSDWYIIEGNLGIDLQNLEMLADLNGDWKVDDADMDILYGNDNLANPTQADGDLDLDGDIDLDDVDLAFAQYGLEVMVVG